MNKWWAVFFGVVLGACFLLFVFAPAAGWWLPFRANDGDFPEANDKLFYIILALTAFFFVLTEAVLVWCMWKYAEEPGRRAEYFHGNHTLEVAWTIGPATILLFIAFVQIEPWADTKYGNRMKPAQNVFEVSARQFEWRIRYPDKETRRTLTVPSDRDVVEWNTGLDPSKEKDRPKKARADAWGQDNLAAITDLHVVNEVHTWKGANTRLYLKTRDVLHSFFLPHLRLKQDAVPGKVIPVWFRATEANGHWDSTKNEWVYDKYDGGGGDKVWELACAELCGWGHYKMQGRLYVHKDEASFDAWLDHTRMRHRTTENLDAPKQ